MQRSGTTNTLSLMRTNTRGTHTPPRNPARSSTQSQLLLAHRVAHSAPRTATSPVESYSMVGTTD